MQYSKLIPTSPLRLNEGDGERWAGRDGGSGESEWEKSKESKKYISDWIAVITIWGTKTTLWEGAALLDFVWIQPHPVRCVGTASLLLLLLLCECACVFSLTHTHTNTQTCSSELRRRELPKGFTCGTVVMHESTWCHMGGKIRKGRKKKFLMLTNLHTNQTVWIWMLEESQGKA